MTWKTIIITADKREALDHGSKREAMAVFNLATDRPEVIRATVHYGAMLWATWEGAGTSMALAAAIRRAREALDALERQAVQEGGNAS